MTISINPYADVLNFPPGTPASVINAVLAFKAKQMAMDQQPSWWETGITNALEGFNKNLLTPWLQNTFINMPYQTDLAHMKTNEDIRQFLEQQSGLTSELNTRGQNAQDLANQLLTQQGEAIDEFGNIQNSLTKSPYTESAYGPYADNPAFSAPQAPQIPLLNDMGPVAPTGNETPSPLSPSGTEPVQMQGDVAPSATPRIQVSSPGYTPGLAEVLKVQAGVNPLRAGQMASIFEKNPNMSNILDPMKLQERQAALLKLQTAQAEAESKTNERNQMLPGKLGLQDAQTQAAMARAGLVYSQEDISRLRYGVLQDIQAGRDPSHALLQALNMESRTGNSITSPAKAFFTAQLLPDGDPAKKALMDAYRQYNQDMVGKQVSAAQQTLPMQMAKQEAFKTQEEIGKLQEFKTLASSIDQGADILDKSGFLPKTPDIRDIARAKFNRLTGRQQYENDPDIQGARQVVSQFYGALDVAFVRGIGDQAARIKAAYGLPENPEDITATQIHTIMKLLMGATDTKLGQQIQRLMMLQSYGGGNPTIGGGFLGNPGVNPGSNPISSDAPPGAIGKVPKGSK